MDESARWESVAGLVAFLSLIIAALVGGFAGELVKTRAGATVLMILAVVFVVAVIAIDLPAALDKTAGNTFSELLREGGTQTTIFPWTFAVFAGRWFHPGDKIDLFGIAGPLLLMGLTFVVVAGGDVLRRRGNGIPSWLVVLTGLLAGALLFPADFSVEKP